MTVTDGVFPYEAIQHIAQISRTHLLRIVFKKTKQYYKKFKKSRVLNSGLFYYMNFITLYPASSIAFLNAFVSAFSVSITAVPFS